MPILLAFVQVALHLPGIARYGYFRDELYYLACARHLAWGYVDQPPLSIAALAGWRALFGDSLASIHVVPILLGAATVVLTAALARRLGGGPYARFLAALAAAFSPIYLGTTRYWSMNSFDLLFWTAGALLLHRCLERGSRRDWILFGVLVGLGLMNKISVLWFAGGSFLAMALTPGRRRLLTPWPWIAAAIAGALFLPYVLWEMGHGWPTLEFMRNATAEKNVHFSPVAFAAQQVMAMNPAALPIWLTGLVATIRSPEPGRRGLGVTFLAVAVVLVASGASKPDYLAPAYPMLLAPGAVAIERALSRRRLRWIGPALPAAVALLGLVALPIAVPILPVDAYVRYSRALGITPPQAERLAVADLPQHYADMFGWEEISAAVGEAYRSLPPADRARAIVIAQNYGEAAALEFFGPKTGEFPRVACGHNSYWYWGVGRWKGEVAIVLGGDLDGYRKRFSRLEPEGVVPPTRGMPYERNLTISVIRGLRVPMAEYWRWERLII
ncbi:MAG TPA: glycosyltransferase family 39 protein [Candidatus Eisenbacteria bacterium]